MAEGTWQSKSFAYFGSFTQVCGLPAIAGLRMFVCIPYGVAQMQGEFWLGEEEGTGER